VETDGLPDNHFFADVVDAQCLTYLQLECRRLVDWKRTYVVGMAFASRGYGQFHEGTNTIMLVCDSV